MAKNKKEHINDDGSYVVKKSKKSSVFAFIVCVILAFAIWLYSANVKVLEEKKANNAVSGDVTSTEKVGE